MAPVRPGLLGETVPELHTPLEREALHGLLPGTFSLKDFKTIAVWTTPPPPTGPASQEPTRLQVGWALEQTNGYLVSQMPKPVD